MVRVLGAGTGYGLHPQGCGWMWSQRGRGGGRDHPAAESTELHFHVSHFSESLPLLKSFHSPGPSVGVVNVIPLHR